MFIYLPSLWNGNAILVSPFKISADYNVGLRIYFINMNAWSL
jgi:hypothetical protein